MRDELRAMVLGVVLTVAVCLPPAWAAMEILSVSTPIPNIECQGVTGRMIAEGIEIQLRKAGDVYSLTIPAWNPDTFQPWTKGELRGYITLHTAYYEGVAKPEPEPDLALFDSYDIDDATLKAFVKLLIKEINILRAKAGLDDRTWEQFMTALRMELNTE